MSESTRPPLRVGLVGCGHISSRHIPAWQACPDAELVAVCDIDNVKAHERAREFGIRGIYSDVGRMIEYENLDCVDIATRPSTHKALVSLVTERGVHALCQKPLAPTIEEAIEIVDIAEGNGTRFMVLEMFRHIPSYLAMARELNTGIIGPPHSLRILGHRRPMNRFHPVNPEQPYFAEMPMLLIYEMFIHWVDGARSIVGDVESVFARVAKVNPVIAGEDHALMVMGHTNGVTTLIDASWASPSERPRAGAAGDLLLEGRDGSLHFDALTGELRHITFDDTRVIESFAQQPSGPSAAFGGCIADFAAAIRHDRPMMSDGRDNLKTLAATLAAYESVERGTAVRPAL